MYPLPNWHIKKIDVSITKLTYISISLEQTFSVVPLAIMQMHIHDNAIFKAVWEMGVIGPIYKIKLFTYNIIHKTRTSRFCYLYSYATNIINELFLINIQIRWNCLICRNWPKNHIYLHILRGRTKRQAKEL